MIRILLAALLLVSFSAAPALAGKPDNKGKGHGNKSNKGSQGYHDDGDRGHHGDDDDDFDLDVDVIFSPQQRDMYRGYHVEHYGRGHCPPGLAKKNNGCMPPGLAKKRYEVGRPLPPDLVILDLPYDLGVRIGPAPRGYRYGLIDGDVVKLALGTLLVVDAIDGLTD